MKLDKPTLLGLGACVLAVAAFSAFSQFETARMAGVPIELAWVLPMTTDATGFVATRVWLTPTCSAGLRHYAALVALTCIALSFGGAAAHLAFIGQPMPWQMRLLVGGLPSLALAALVHLGALLAAEGKESAAKPAKAPRKPKTAPQTAGAVGHRPPTSAAPVSTPEPVVKVAPEPPPVSPEIGSGSTRDQMLAYLNEHGEVSGAELDRIFKTRDYGRGVLRTWRKHHPVATASGE